MNASARYGRKRTETLDYMQSMLGQLRSMAEAERYDMLAYLIEMAYIEAGDIIRGERPMRVRNEASDTTVGEKKRNGTS
ncbi:MAG TPA: hypothetical protein VFT89_09215 [Rhizobiaceae bacterium]|nr:hypothetical protein [Rhizobiaceae bacterium]